MGRARGQNELRLFDSIALEGRYVLLGELRECVVVFFARDGITILIESVFMLQMDGIGVE